jgi:hypothetical protein
LPIFLLLLLGIVAGCEPVGYHLAAPVHQKNNRNSPVAWQIGAACGNSIDHARPSQARSGKASTMAAFVSDIRLAPLAR